MLTVSAISIFTDNYVWVIAARGREGVYVVDPGDATPVLRYLAQHRLALAGVLITHSHRDHVAGIEPLIARHPAPVYGPALPQISHVLDQHSELQLWGSVPVRIVRTPGHLPEHLSYYIAIPATPQHAAQSLLFCGDTLFSSGCGRIFIGSPEALKHSIDTLMQLPDETAVYCAHEYTLANLQFAKAVEPDNPALGERERQVRALRQAGKPSLPSSIGLERRVNPFARCDQKAVQKAASAYLGRQILDQQDVFTTLRTWKNNF